VTKIFAKNNNIVFILYPSFLILPGNEKSHRFFSILKLVRDPLIWLLSLFPMLEVIGGNSRLWLDMLSLEATSEQI